MAGIGTKYILVSLNDKKAFNDQRLKRLKIKKLLSENKTMIFYQKSFFGKLCSQNKTPYF